LISWVWLLCFNSKNAEAIFTAGAQSGSRTYARYQLTAFELEFMKAATANLLAALAFNFCSDSGKLHGPNLIDLIRTKREHIRKP